MIAAVDVAFDPVLALAVAAAAEFLWSALGVVVVVPIIVLYHYFLSLCYC